MRFVISALALFWTATAFAAPLTLEQLASNPACAALDAPDAATGEDASLPERVAIARHACRLPVIDLDPTTAEGVLGEEHFAITRDGDTLTIFARDVDEATSFAGSLRGNFERIGQSRFGAARFRLADIERASIRIFILNTDAPAALWRGPNAPPPLEPQPTLIGRELELTLHSEALGETRRLKVYLPPNHRPGGDYPAVFFADGGSVSYYARIIEPLIESGALPPLVLVGALSGQQGIVEDRSALGSDIRALDYLPGWRGDTERFPRHMRFFSQELVAFAVREFFVTRDATRRVVAGHSNGATFAFWAAYTHPEIFGNAIISSQGWRAVENIAETQPRARFFMHAGLYEQPFLYRTRGVAADLRAHGYDVTYDELADGHNGDQSSFMLLERLQRIF